MEKLLLVTMTPPGTRNVGEVILRDLCALLPPGALAVCDVGSASPVPGDVPYRYVAAPSEAAWRPLGGRAGGLLNHLRVRTKFARDVQRACREVLEFAREQGARRLLVVLNSQSITAMAASLRRASGLPMSVVVWDPQHATALNMGWDSASARWTDTRFAEAMRVAERAMVVSEEMVEEYSRRFGSSCEIVRHALRDFAAVDAPGQGPLRIGFAGTMYDTGQLSCLLAALNQCAWELHGRPVALRMIGNHYRFTALDAPAQVELLGWRGATETARLLSECDFCYLPIAFTSAFADLARLSFPTKLSSYLGAGRAVLVHGPEASSSVRFARRQGIGETCSTMDPLDLAAALRRQADPSLASSRARAVEQTRAEHFSREVMRSAFARFLQVPDAELLP